MKVTNHKIGSSSHHVDTGGAAAKSGKAEGARGLDKDFGLGKLGGKDGVKNSANVEVSERAQMMQKAKDIARAGAGGVDEAKVARLQKLIDEGKYSVDAGAVADRLVDEHLNIPD
jgi:negative regulator of flagellin synthesis FlgM